MCYEDYAGPLCEEIWRAEPAADVFGMLSAGEIHYYRMDIASDKNMKHYSVRRVFGAHQVGPVIEFHKNRAGHG